MSARTDTERLDWLEKTGGDWDVYQGNGGNWYIDDDGEYWSGRTLREALDKLIDDYPSTRLRGTP